MQGKEIIFFFFQYITNIIIYHLCKDKQTLQETASRNVLNKVD